MRHATNGREERQEGPTALGTRACLLANTFVVETGDVLLFFMLLFNCGVTSIEVRDETI